MAVMREMTQETVKWIKDFLEAVKDCFGERLLCAGIQGSRARGEEKANSDIDVVVILDKLDFDDLKAYDDVVSALPEREKLCGFLSGCAELAAWEKSELFQFVFDTKVLYGSLDFVQLGTEEGSIISTIGIAMSSTAARAACIMPVCIISCMKNRRKFCGNCINQRFLHCK